MVYSSITKNFLLWHKETAVSFEVYLDKIELFKMRDNIYLIRIFIPPKFHYGMTSVRPVRPSVRPLATSCPLNDSHGT